MTDRSRITSESGLSTLEALVAVALLGLALLPILAFQNQMLRSYSQYADLNARSVLEKNALAVLRDMNPMEHTDGRIELGQSQTVTWRAERISETTRGTGHPIGDGDFVIALYAINALIEDAAEKRSIRIIVERIGWRDVASGTPASRVENSPP